MADPCIVSFTPERAGDFARLNQAWIEQFFRMEESDYTMLRNPQAYILDGGGQIFFAIDGDETIGTVAAARVSDTTFELAKMAVSPSHQGRGLGRLLGEAAIAYARSQGATTMFLDTSSKLPTAIALYERLGFRHTTPPEPSRYARSDVYMELALGAPE